MPDSMKNCYNIQSMSVHKGTMIILEESRQKLSSTTQWCLPGEKQFYSYVSTQGSLTYTQSMAWRLGKKVCFSGQRYPPLTLYACSSATGKIWLSVKSELNGYHKTTPTHRHMRSLKHFTKCVHRNETHSPFLTAQLQRCSFVQDNLILSHRKKLYLLLWLILVLLFHQVSKNHPPPQSMGLISQ